MLLYLHWGFGHSVIVERVARSEVRGRVGMGLRFWRRLRCCSDGIEESFYAEKGFLIERVGGR